ncbi:glycosyltransferase [Glaciecola petra]|uniref:Glycosyltransferase n=1 Tax=Glaciecola petra TaxID=3075602 RepID=A0ABU2ZUT0_9ALTE|nr:glycosyltransferase [Aestuariibacter sp. P117]MDT0595177.1 glycosyltransferase [Aestuariibacter sp. P117]
MARDDLIPLDGNFRKKIADEFKHYLAQESTRFDKDNCLKIDLHCHDENSDVPDELWGRILRVPETWLKTKKLVKRLEKTGCTVNTVTNHNNARSCWDLQDKGIDVLPAAEFTCYFDEYNLYLHVLTYGFDREQEKVLNKKRQDIYDFLRYATEKDIPVILPHPLYFYTENENIDFELFEKLAVMFQRFEVLNGQRDLWQSVLTLNWTQSLTPEKIRAYGKKHNLNPADFGVDPDQAKVLTGGSDDHMGIFVGDCGSWLYVENLKQRLETQKPSELALEAIKKGNVSPFGVVLENEKLQIALLDYFAQVATKMKDPGLFRLMFHRGELKDKVSCFVIANVFLELQKRKNINKFLNFVSDTLRGKKPGKLVKWQVHKDYRFCIDYLEQIADANQLPQREFAGKVNESIHKMFNELCLLVVQRLRKASPQTNQTLIKGLFTEDFAGQIEMPSQLSVLFYGNHKKDSNSEGDIGSLIDNLAFPLLILLVILSTMVASTRVLYANRRFLNRFSDYIGKGCHQKRALYLTDTLCDKNGVSNSLSGKLKEIQKYDYPVDFLICHESAKSEPHLHVVKPITSFCAPDYGEQEIRVPDLLEICKIFYEGGYDRIVCSTEGPMAVVSLLIKFKFNVPSYFFMHTDWMDFIKETTDLNKYQRDRIRRIFRALYQQFDGIFTLNSDHKAWLSGYEMELDPNKIFMTAHHAQPATSNVIPVNKQALFADATQHTPILFVACRVSREKGLFELPDLLARVKKHIPDIKLVIAGQGPAEEELKQVMPEAKFLGWLDKQTLASMYAGLDLFVFPSQFDTFGNVILESFVNGMPAISYNCKGPKDIIQNNISGYLVDSPEQMADKIVEYFSSVETKQVMKLAAKARADEYQAEPIMKKFLSDMGLEVEPIAAEVG